ncbi:PUA-like domain-containing protein, partial [Macrophomina phaseolina]
MPPKKRKSAASAAAAAAAVPDTPRSTRATRAAPAPADNNNGHDQQPAELPTPTRSKRAKKDDAPAKKAAAPKKKDDDVPATAPKGRRGRPAKHAKDDAGAEEDISAGAQLNEELEQAADEAVAAVEAAPPAKKRGRPGKKAAATAEPEPEPEPEAAQEKEEEEGEEEEEEEEEEAEVKKKKKKAEAPKGGRGKAAKKDTAKKTEPKKTAESKKPSGTANIERDPANGLAYWLMKAEPESRIENGKDVKFSIDDLAAASEPEPWDGVRNHVAKNHMLAMKKGDLAFFYHSNCKTPGIVGIMEIAEEASPDESAFDSSHPYYDAKSKREKPSWFCVKVSFRRKFARPETVTLDKLKALSKEGQPLENMQLFKQSRLSVSNVRPEEWNHILGIASE